MSRDIHESPENKNNENLAKIKIENFLKTFNPNYILKNMPFKYPIDFVAMTDDIIKGFIEYKRHSGTFNDYPHKIISYHKILFLNLIRNRNENLYSRLFIELNDGIFYCNIKDHIDGCELFWGGRTRNPRDKDDLEIMVRIPNKNFIKI